MNATFDTHAFVKQLRNVGFTEEQAEVFTAEYQRMFDDRVATKGDVNELRRDVENIRAELQRDIENTRTELKRDIENTRTELIHDIERLRSETRQAIAQSQMETTRWLTGVIVGAVFVQVGLISWLIQQLVHR